MLFYHHRKEPVSLFVYLISISTIQAHCLNRRSVNATNQALLNRIIVNNTDDCSFHNPDMKMANEKYEFTKSQANELRWIVSMYKETHEGHMSRNEVKIVNNLYKKLKYFSQDLSLGAR